MTTLIYTNKETNLPGVRPEEWIANISDLAEKQRIATLFNIESERFSNGDVGEPAAEFDAVFMQYQTECNIEPGRTD